MVTQGNFKEDLKIGRQIEEAFIDKLKQNNPTAKITHAPDTVFGDWDVMMEVEWKPTLTFEVKYDMLSNSTGNVAFEVAFKGSPSWLKTSKADYRVYYIGKQFRVCKTILIEKLMLGYEFVKWWDDYNSDLRLVTMDDFKNIFTLYN